MPRGMPIELTSFVGRRQELAEGRRILRSVPLVTLVGPGGVGKTRIARRLARQVETVFPDGVVMVELAFVKSPEALATTTATALGVDPQGRSPDVAVAAYLATRRLLLVLDNCEHLLAACAELVSGLMRHAPELRVLATSRQALRVYGEHLMHIEPLAVPTEEEAATGAVSHIDAVALLADRARAIDQAFRVDSANAADVSRLCRRLDGIPLAVELAVARLRVLSLTQLVERLDERFEVLTIGPRAALPQHQTLRGLVDWSHDLCSSAEQALWARMSVFEGGADLEAIEAVCGETGHAESATSDALTGLVEKSVVTEVEGAGGPRFGMLETIREYGLWKLTVRGELDLMRTRHRDHYVALALRSERSWFGPDQPAWLAWGNDELGNLHASFEHSLATADGRGPACDLVASTMWYWLSSGSLEEGLRWSLRATDSPSEPSVRALRALVAGATIAIEKNELERVKSLAMRALDLRLAERDAEVRALRNRAECFLAIAERDAGAAMAAHEAAMVEFAAIGDTHRQAQHLLSLLVIESFAGRTESAEAHLDTVIRLCEQHGERLHRCEAFAMGGYRLWKLGRHREALASVRECLSLAPVLRTANVAYALDYAARIFTSTGEHERAAVVRGALSHLRDDLGFDDKPYVREAEEESQELLNQVLGREAFATAYERGRTMSLEGAAAFVLGRHGRRRPPPQPARHGRTSSLSKREQEVAALVARGASNKDIASTLGVSVRTTEGHVAKVMNKLGIHSREQIAASFAPRAHE